MAAPAAGHHGGGALVRDRAANLVLAVIVLASSLVALAWVFYVPMFEAPGRITEVITDFLETVQPADRGRRSTG